MSVHPANHWLPLTSNVSDFVIAELPKDRRKAQPTSVVPFGASPTREAGASLA